MKSGRSTEEQLYIFGLLAFVFLGIGVWIYSFTLYPYLKDVGCVFYRLTGFYCPGCGGTRSVIALFHGDLLKSLWYHPLVIYTAVIYFGFMCSHTLYKIHVPFVKAWKYHNWYLFVAAGIVFGNWIIKNVLLFCFGIVMI
jgi:hypothetical protein